MMKQSQINFKDCFSVIFTIINYINLTLFIFLLIIFPAFSEPKLTGYYKNIMLEDENNLLTGQNRLRLKFIIDFSEKLTGDIEYTNQINIGNSMLNPIEKNDTSFLKLDRRLFWDKNLNWKHSFYRAFVKYSFSNMDFTIGRQRIAWGTGRFWNPTDLLNPYNLVTIESGERPGVDGLEVKVNVSRLSYMSFVGVPNKELKKSSLATKYHATIGDHDISFMAGKFKENLVIGADYADSYKGAGIRAESTYTLAKDENSFWKFVLSSDYSISKLYILGEYFYNGQGSRDKSLYRWDKILTGEFMNLAQNYLGLLLSYELMPLLKLNFQTLYNIDDNSFYLSPSLVYSVSPNMEFIGGLNRFTGDKDTEYGKDTTLLFSQLQWSF